MTVRIPPGFALCSVEHWLNGYPRPAVITMGVKILGTQSGNTTVAGMFAGAYQRAFQPHTDSSVTVRNARAVIGQDGGDPIIQESSSAWAGVDNRESTSPAMAVMVTKLTALGGRKHKGRFFLPWAASDSQVSEVGAIGQGTLDALGPACNQFLEDLEQGDEPGTQLLDGAVILHNSVGTPTPITALRVNPTIRTQRRRQVRY